MANSTLPYGGDGWGRGTRQGGRGNRATAGGAPGLGTLGQQWSLAGTGSLSQESAVMALMAQQ